ncbi:MAG: hypothetical protein ACYCQJ_03595 [Nitrososphaerales archaeon]
MRSFKTLLIVIIAFLVFGGHIWSSYSTASGPTTMTHSGSMTVLDLQSIKSISVSPANSYRLALYDGKQWFEIPFQLNQVSPRFSSVQNSSSRSSVTPTLVQSGREYLYFLMPQTMGKTANLGNWWKIASDFKMDSRTELQITDISSGVTTILYLYLSSSGQAPIATYPFLTTVGASLLNLNNSAGLAPTTVSKASPQTGPFVLESSSPLQNSPSSSGDPNVYDHVQVTYPETATFQNDVKNTYSFDMPNGIIYAHLVISGQSQGDGYTRYMYINVNGNPISGSPFTVSGSFSYDEDISGLLNTGTTNQISIQITTWVGYWTVSAQVNVGYSASSHISKYYSYYSTNYVFQNTGYTAQNFNAGVANGTAAGATYLWVYYTDQGDCCSRYLTVQVNGQTITPSGFIVSGSSHWTSGDISSYVEYQKYVRISITITTWSGKWSVWGYLESNARYEVWPGSDSRWGSAHPLAQGTAMIYDENTNYHPNQFLVAPGVTVNSLENYPNPFFYIAVTESIPSWVNSVYNIGSCSGTLCWTGFQISNDIQLTVNGLTSPGDYANVLGYNSPNTQSGTDYDNVASNTFTLISTIASVLPPPYGQSGSVVSAVMAVLVNYLTPMYNGFSYGTNSQGPYLNDAGAVNSNSMSDVLRPQVIIQTQQTYQFTVTVTVMVSIAYTEQGNQYSTSLASNTFTFEGTYTY